MAIVYNQECILGIKLNGCSFNIACLNISDDQAPYDYNCNVNPKSHVNGNGSFTISITNKDYIQGLPLGTWILLEGLIVYDWGESISYFYLLDMNGVKTNKIRATVARGSARGFQIEGLGRAIFSKAREVIEKFPSASVYNAYSNFMNTELRPSSTEVKKFLELESPTDVISCFQSKTLEKYSIYLQSYSELMNILSKIVDVRAKRLIDEVNMECCKVLKFLK